MKTVQFKQHNIFWHKRQNDEMRFEQTEINDTTLDEGDGYA